MGKEFSLKLSGAQRWDLWLFFYEYGGYAPRDRDQARNLGAVVDALKLKEIQDAVDELRARKEGSLMPSDFPAVECPIGSVDLKRTLEFTEKFNEKMPAGFILRIVEIADYLIEVRDHKLLQEIG